MEKNTTQSLQTGTEKNREFDSSFRSKTTEASGGDEISAEPIFDNLVWMTSAEAARYLRKSVGALRTAVCRKQLRARKWRRRLYFKRSELDRLIDCSEWKGAI